MSNTSDERSAEPLALVTGANRGLGLRTAQGLARDGYHVLMGVRDNANAEAALFRVSDGGQADLVQLDVTEDDAGARAQKAVGEHDGELQVLVNNAGVALGTLDAEVARRTIAVNVWGVLRITDALAPRMPAGARIVMVSSGMGELSALGPELREKFGASDLGRRELRRLLDQFVRDVAANRHIAAGWPSSAYRVSKVALNALTRILAREHPSLKVNAVCPGWVRTDMGGPNASRSIDEGAASILWATRIPADGPTGGFFRDGHPIGW